MKAFKHLIKYALAQGHTVSVFDGEEWQLKRSTKYRAIVEAVESVEEAALRIRDSRGAVLVPSITVSGFGLVDDETVIDHTDNEYMVRWQAAYDLKQLSDSHTA